MTDEELGIWLAPDLPLEDRLKIVEGLTPEKRSTFEKMCWVAEELNQGRVPPGVIVCR